MKKILLVLSIVLVALLVLGCDNVLHNRGIVGPELESGSFDGIKVYVPVALGLSHVWWWDAEGISPDSNSDSGWPGDEMTIDEDDTDFYVFILEDATASNIIFNNDGQGDQTSDLEVTAQGVYWLNADKELVAIE